MQLLIPNREKIEVIAHVLPCKKNILIRYFPIFTFHKLEGQSDFFYGCDNDNSEFNRVCILANEFSRKYCTANCASNGLWSQQQSHKETKKIGLGHP